jgi:hypothetical protein
MGSVNSKTLNERKIADKTTVEHNNINIQQGLSSEQFFSLMQLFSENMVKLQNVAAKTACERAQELTSDFNHKLLLQEQKINRITKRLAEPDMQLAFFEAQKGYAKTGDKNKLDLLTDLLIDKGEEKKNSLKDHLINEAIEIIPKLTSQQIDFLSLFALRYLRRKNILDLTSFKEYLNKVYLPFKSCIPISSSDLMYMQQLNCINLSDIPTQDVSFLSNFREHYKGLFATGFTVREIKQELDVEDYKPFVIKALNNRSLIQIRALSEKSLYELFGKHNTPAEKQAVLKKYFNMTLSDGEIETKIIKLVPGMREILHASRELNNFKFSPLGKLIAAHNIRIKTGTHIDWELD